MVIIFVAFFFAGALVAGTDTGSAEFAQTQNDLNTLSMTAGVHQTETWGIFNFVTTPFDYFNAMMRVWNYQSPVFDGGYGFIKFFTTTPVVIAAVASIAFGMLWLFKS